MKALKISLACSLGFGLLFATFSLIFYFGDWRRLAFVFLAGLFVGLVAAPELEPKSFKSAWLLQLVGGTIFGALVAIGFQLETGVIALASIAGGILGWSAPIWAKHVPVP